MPLTGQLGTQNSQLGEIQPGAQISEVTSQLGAPFSEPGNVEPGIGANTVGLTGQIGTFQSDPGNVEPGLGAQGGLTGFLGTSRSDPENVSAGYGAGSYYTHFTAQLGTSQSLLANIEAGENAGSYIPNFTAQLGIQQSSLANIEIGEGGPAQSGGNHYVVPVSDTVTVTDALTAIYHAITSESDTVTVTDAVSEHHTTSAAVSDTVTVSDALTAKYHAITSESDTVTVTDATSEHHTTSASVSDTVTVTDATTELHHTSASVSDTVTVTDAVTGIRRTTASVSDTVTVTDATSELHHANVPTSDTVTVTDASAEQHSTTASVSDTVSVTDFLTLGRFYPVPVSDTVTVTDATTQSLVLHTGLSDTVSVTDASTESQQQTASVSDTVGASDSIAFHYQAGAHLFTTVPIVEALNVGTGSSIIANGTSLTAGFTLGMRIDGIPNLNNYTVTPLDGPAGFPVTLLSAAPTYTVLQTGSNASITATTEIVDSVPVPVTVVSIPSVNFTTLGAAYLFLASPTNNETWVRILSILSPTSVIVDRPMLTDPQNGTVLWQATSAVKGVSLTTTKFTDGGSYTFFADGLFTLDGTPVRVEGPFVATSPHPQVSTAATLNDGQILVTFNDDMLVDEDLQNPTEYILTGPGNPYIESVTTVNASQVLLLPRNLAGGSYSLQVGTNTPHDLAGNPIDPFFNTVAFTTSPPIISRSIFTDFGPIARPPLTLETGTGVTFVDFQTVTILGASIPSTFAGFELALSGTAKNDGSYLITAIKTQNTVKVVASFNLPDTGAATATWSVVNPRDGEIADDPAHVSVTINGFPVVPEEVVGLLGQIVLPPSVAPIPDGQNVLVNYSWIQNPTVEIRRLNSREFRLNDFNRDLGYLEGGRNYRFNNVLPVTTNFTTPPPVQQGSHAGIVSTSQVSLPDGNVLTDYAGLTLILTAGINAGQYDIVSVPSPNLINVTPSVNPADPLSGSIPWTIGDSSDIQAILPQPLLRDLKYRAYERAYTALLNDPNTLTLNAPTNLIAYPPLSRIVAQTFVSYESSVLPENDPTAPWTRVGTGTASIVSLQLVVTSPTSGTFPGGSPIYWLQDVDQTFPHVFASTWDMQINATPVSQGVFTGVCFGYSDDNRVLVLGYLKDGGTNKIGFLVKGGGNDPSVITAWTGALDASGNPTNVPAVFDWSTLHSYRIYQDPSGNISLYLDGAVVANLSVLQSQLPYLEELAAPFNTLQGVFFGSLSAQAQSTSTWDFVRYLVLPLNPLQTAPSIFVDYVANVVPEAAAKPWTPVGYHGTETIIGSAFLLLDSTSAVPPATEVQTGLVGGDFRGFFRLEPLIATNAEVVVDFGLQVRTWTHGYSPNAMMVAIDDSDRLIQLSFISDSPAPKFSYGGDGFPPAQTPPWTALGGQAAQMLGRTLQIVDTSTSDGLVYVIDDTSPLSPFQNHFAQSDAIVASSSMTAMATVHHTAAASIHGTSALLPPDIGTSPGAAHWAVAGIIAGAAVVADATANRTASASILGGSRVSASALASPRSRTLSPDNSYILEARLEPIVWVADPGGFIGAQAQVYDSYRALGFMLLSIAGTTYVALQGDGTVVAQFPFNWNDGNLHTYRVVYSPGFPDGVVTLFVDGLLVGSPQPYSSFPVPVPSSTVGFVSFGSSTAISNEATSTVNWIYCNAWRVEAGNRFVGVWRGTTNGSLLDYWVPTKATGSNALVLGNAMMDTGASFVSAGVQMGDYLIVDAGPNQGVYTISGVTSNTLSIDTLWPQGPSRVTYRIAQQTDWTQQHGYRIVKAPSGDDVAVFLDGSDTPLIFLTYDDTILPASQVGLPRIIAGTLPSISWGAFDPSNLSQSSWQYLRYGVTRSPTELRIIPPHQVLNQRNIIQSYERHLTNIPHTLTDFWSESEGITPNTYPDLLTNPNLVAFTLLNEGTPLVPQTQTYEVQSPQPVVTFVGGINNIANVLNSSAFLLNDATRRVAIIVPDNVLYNSLQIFERDTGQSSLIAPFSDESQPTWGPFNFQDEVCLTYDAQTLPEDDPTAITPWTFFAQDPTQVTRTVFGGVLTYGTLGSGTQTIYRNETPLPDAPSMQTQVSFRLKLLQDSSLGLGDSQVRFGFSAIGLTASLALVTYPTGQRYVLVIDQLSNEILGGIPFDFGDSQFHTYTLVRNPGSGTVQVSVT